MKSKDEMIVPILWKNLNDEPLTTEEQRTLNSWLEDSIHNQETFEEVMNDEKRNSELKLLLTLDRQVMWEKTLSFRDRKAAKPAKVRGLKPWFKYAAAAAAIVVVSGGAWFFLNQKPQDKIAAATSTHSSGKPGSYISPASDKALLTLEDGSEYDLRKVKGDIPYNNGKNNFQNTWKEQGSVVRFPKASPSAGQLPLTFNTLSTPRGGRYQLILPDGSQVWLNAGSNFRFPTFFDSKKRVVELTTGEAYFEVEEVEPVVSVSGSTLTKVPFFVKVNGVEIEVVGTQFNVKAYTEEPEITTTLLEGKVKISKGNQKCNMKPGDQVLVNNQQGALVKFIRRQLKNPADAIAWNNNIFSLANRTTVDIAREVARWYDLDLQLPTVVPYKIIPEGDVRSDAAINTTIKTLEKLGVHLKVEGRKLILLA